MRLSPGSALLILQERKGFAQPEVERVTCERQSRRSWRPQWTGKSEDKRGQKKFQTSSPALYFFQYFGHLMWRVTHCKRPWYWERLRAGGEGDTDSMDMSLSRLQEIVKDRGAWHATVHGVPGSRAWLSNYTTTTIIPAQVGLVAGLPPLIMFLHSLDKHFLNSCFALGQTKLIHNMTLTIVYHWLTLNT